MAYYNPYNPYQYQQNFMQQAQNTFPQQIQNGGFVSVRSEAEARNYPVALGNSVTFKDETSPYIYTKTMGFSQLDVPKFDKYKLVKEPSSDDLPARTEGLCDTKPLWQEVDGVKGEIAALWKAVGDLKNDHIQSNNVSAVPVGDQESGGDRYGE